MRQNEPFPCGLRTKRSRRHRGRLHRLLLGDIDNKTNNCSVSDFLPLIPVGWEYVNLAHRIRHHGAGFEADAVLKFRLSDTSIPAV